MDMELFYELREAMKPMIKQQRRTALEAAALTGLLARRNDLSGTGELARAVQRCVDELMKNDAP